MVAAGAGPHGPLPLAAAKLSIFLILCKPSPVFSCRFSALYVNLPYETVLAVYRRGVRRQ